MTKQLEALKPGKYAILYLDNWDGEGDTYHTIANLEADGRWSDNETGKELLGYQGDEILKAWPLDDGQETLTLIAALEQAQQYAKQRDEENQDLMLTIGRLRVEREQLQASTLVVKLPPIFMYEHDDLSADVPVMDARKVKAAIRAAGGKVE